MDTNLGWMNTDSKSLRRGYPCSFLGRRRTVVIFAASLFFRRGPLLCPGRRFGIFAVIAIVQHFRSSHHLIIIGFTVIGPSAAAIPYSAAATAIPYSAVAAAATSSLSSRCASIFIPPSTQI